jgi:GntR family transcriptional regulator
MDLDLDPRSPVPLYEQIAARFRLAIAAEDVTAGDGLPSVRKLASTLRVNPSTVVQAYRDLERDGWVETRHGAGTFVLDRPESARAEERSAQARRLVRDLVAEARRAGLPLDALRGALEEELG